MSSEPGERSVEDVLAEMGAVTGHHGGDLHAVGEFRATPQEREDTTSETGAQTQDAHTQPATQDAGDIPADTAIQAIPPDVASRARELARDVSNRLRGEKRWFGQIDLERNEMMRIAKKNGMSKPEAQVFVYSELDRMYPPLDAREGDTVISTDGQGKAASPADDGAIQGLGAIPEDWPELPANSSLAQDVAWVQANRLRIVEEQPGRATVVTLSLSLTPAPSWAALGWLETSIRSYAKFVDVVARASTAQDNEASVMRHERRAIEEVAALLDEMREDA